MKKKKQRKSEKKKKKEGKKEARGLKLCEGVRYKEKQKRNMEIYSKRSLVAITISNNNTVN